MSTIEIIVNKSETKPKFIQWKHIGNNFYMKFDYTNISYKITIINNDKCWVQCATKEFLENKCKELKIVYDDIFQIICYLENIILHETFSILQNSNLSLKINGQLPWIFECQPTELTLPVAKRVRFARLCK